MEASTGPSVGRGPTALGRWAATCWLRPTPGVGLGRVARGTATAVNGLACAAPAVLALGTTVLVGPLGGMCDPPACGGVAAGGGAGSGSPSSESLSLSSVIVDILSTTRSLFPKWVTVQLSIWRPSNEGGEVTMSEQQGVLPFGLPGPRTAGSTSMMVEE